MKISNHPVILLDLDRMLFDSDRFMDDAARTLCECFGIDPKRFKEEYADYCVSDGEMRHYDMFRQTLAYGICQESAEQAIRNELGDNDYAYDDVADFIVFAREQSDTVMVLTHGVYGYQYLKYSFAPALHGIEFKDVLTHKRNYIAERFTGRYGFLIDDRQVGPLPAGFRHVWVSRYDVPGAYHSLQEVQEAWPTLCTTSPVA